MVKKIKDSKLKLQAAIQGDLVRISGKDRDTLQQAIALLKGVEYVLKGIGREADSTVDNFQNKTETRNHSRRSPHIEFISFMPDAEMNSRSLNCGCEFGKDMGIQ